MSSVQIQNGTGLEQQVIALKAIVLSESLTGLTHRVATVASPTISPSAASPTSAEFH